MVMILQGGTRTSETGREKDWMRSRLTRDEQGLGTRWKIVIQLSRERSIFGWLPKILGTELLERIQAEK